jgi:hypothetical protein
MPSLAGLPFKLMAVGFAVLLCGMLQTRLWGVPQPQLLTARQVETTPGLTDAYVILREYKHLDAWKVQWHGDKSNTTFTYCPLSGDPLLVLGSPPAAAPDATPDPHELKDVRLFVVSRVYDNDTGDALPGHPTPTPENAPMQGVIRPLNLVEHKYIADEIRKKGGTVNPDTLLVFDPRARPEATGSKWIWFGGFLVLMGCAPYMRRVGR